MLNVLGFSSIAQSEPRVNPQGVLSSNRNSINGLTMTTYRRKPCLADPSVQYQLSISRASFMKVLLYVGIFLAMGSASAQEVRPRGEMLSDALPPTSVVVSSPSAAPSPANSPSPATATAKLAANQKPLIIWHQVHGRWHWHCLAHCSKYRGRHEGPGEQITEFPDPGGR
jgi:hypothetical protein